MNTVTMSLLSTALYCLLAAAAQADTARSTVALDGIRNIHLLGPYHLVVSQGEEEYVTIVAERDYIDEVEARIKGDTLALGRKREGFWQRFGSRPDRDVRFEVQVKSLKYLANRGSGAIELMPLRSDGEFELSAQGSGKVQADFIGVASLALKVMGSGATEINRLEANTLSVRVNGSGDVDLGGLRASDNNGFSKASFATRGSGNIRVAAGEFDSLDVSVHGSGGIDAGNLRVREAKVRINGSGDVELNALDILDARINGSGDVRHRGQPANLQRSINGSGNVQQLN